MENTPVTYIPIKIPHLNIAVSLIFLISLYNACYDQDLYRSDRTCACSQPPNSTDLTLLSYENNISIDCFDEELFTFFLPSVLNTHVSQIKAEITTLDFEFIYHANIYNIKSVCPNVNYSNVSFYETRQYK